LPRSPICAMTTPCTASTFGEAEPHVMRALTRPDADGRRAIRDGLSVGLAVSAYGVSFGALAVAAGLDVWQACVLSLLMFSGGSQFALIGVLATGGVAAGPAAIAGATLLGTRNAVYAMRMGPVI